MWWKIALLFIAGLAAFIAAAGLYGAKRWQSSTQELHAQLKAASAPATPQFYDPRELDELPAPVQRYFRTVLKAGQPLVTGVSMEQAGTFNMSPDKEQWRPFTAHQRVVLKQPGFVWDARIAALPGVPVHVHDAYVAGEGILRAALFGLVPLAEQRGTPDIAQGELMRFLAEAALYPTALLPSQGVRWEAVDDNSARATLQDGENTVTMLFRFNAAGLIESARAEARARTAGGKTIPTPWEGRWSNYELRNGMLIPLEGEVAWVFPEGPKPYWRGRITSLTCEF